MTTELIILTVLTSIIIILMIYSFITNREILQYVTSMSLVLIFIFGWVLFAGAVPVKKYETKEKVEVYNIEKTLNGVNVHTVEYGVIEFDKAIDYNSINDSTTFYVTKYYNHYHSEKCKKFTYKN